MGLLDFLYPRECSVCSRLISEADRLSLCAECDGALEWIAPPACARCGAAEVKGACGECAGKSFGFDGAVALGRYAGKLREAVLSLKFRGARPLADEFGRRLAARIGRRFDLVTPVPMGTWRLLSRGYNAAELLARRLAKHGGMKYFGRALRKTRRTRPQTGLPLEERLSNPAGAYRARKVGGVALLVDDVMTTGATASACARALRDAGASEVHVAVVAR